MSKELIIGLYLDYVNNFLTVERFAEYYGLTISEANQLINVGREINERLAIEEYRNGLTTLGELSDKGLIPNAY